HSRGPQCKLKTLVRGDWLARSRSAPTLCESDVAASRKHVTLTKSLEWPEKNGEKSVRTASSDRPDLTTYRVWLYEAESGLANHRAVKNQRYRLPSKLWWRAEVLAICAFMGTS